MLQLLEEGENTLTFEVADGWYRGSVGAWGMKNFYGTETKLLAQLELTEVSGNIITICSDSSFDWSNDGPIRFADNKDGEIVEAWQQASYGGKAKEAACSVVPSASNNVPVTEHERFPAEVITTPSGKKILCYLRLPICPGGDGCGVECGRLYCNRSIFGLGGDACL